MGTALWRDIAGLTKSVYALDPATGTAATTGDATTVDGATIDSTLVPAQSVVFQIPAKAVLTAAKSLTVKATVEHSDDGTTWTTLVSEVVALTLTNPSTTTGATMTGVARIGADLNKAKRYYRVTVFPDLNATSADTLALGAGSALLGGAPELP